MSPNSTVKTAYRQIRLKKQHPSIAAKIEAEHKLSPIAARVLAARGFKPGTELRNFINPSLKEGLPDPARLKGLDAACELIAKTVGAGKKIAISCDFDVDGLSGGAQLHHFLKLCGAQSLVLVPDRFSEGYGLNQRIIEDAARAQASVLVCIDFGTRNTKELELARSLGLQTVVIDHHHVGEHTPPADVFINPQQPGCGFAEGLLCASGLTWYLLVGLRKAIKSAVKIDVRGYLDLACLGTICDMVPLVGANRVIAKRGLEILSSTERVGLKSLKNVIGLNNQVSCSHVSFGIGPRLNAAGRMESGEMVIDLLTTSDCNVSDKIARQLNKLNLERQETEGLIKDKAIEQVRAKSALPHGIAVWGDDYHTGVIGIVAQRLVEAFYRPSAVIGLDSDDVYKGSVRGIKGFSVVEALESVGEFLIKFGGHEGAGGFAIERAKLNDFAQAFDAECQKRLREIQTNPISEADTEVGLADVSVELIDELESFAPFGMGNPGPLLLLNDLKVTDVKILKGTHLKATLSDGTRYISGLLWRHTHHPALLAGHRVNIVCKPDCNTFNGNLEVQANLQAIEKAA